MQSEVTSSNTISAQLLPGERLLWTGQPRQGLMLRPSDWMQVPFSLLWGGFAFFWEGSVLSVDAPLVMRLWGIPFVLMGLYLILGRFFVDARQRARTRYALTSERVIIVGGLYTSTTTSLQLRTLSEVSLSESADGTGTITFGAPARWWAGSGGWPASRGQLAPSFDSIADVRAVYDQLRRAQQA